MPIAYSADALVYDSGTNSWSLRTDYDPYTHRVDIDITDDDGVLDGDAGADEVGSDSNQTAVVTDMAGNTIASGQIYDEEFYAVWDGVNPTQFIERVEIGGVHVGYIVNVPLVPGTSYSESARGEADGPTAPDYSSFSDVPCFAPGTMILTDKGEAPVQWLTPGDRIITLDQGLQTLRWVGCYNIPVEQLKSNPALCPVRIPPDAFGKAAPGRALLLSPQHRVLLGGFGLTVFFDLDEALCAAKFCGDRVYPQVIGQHFTYYHLLFDRHQIIRSNGLWTESLFVGAQTCAISHATGVRPPAGITHEMQARPSLRGQEARILFTAHLSVGNATETSKYLARTG